MYLLWGNQYLKSVSDCGGIEWITNKSVAFRFSSVQAAAAIQLLLREKGYDCTVVS